MLLSWERWSAVVGFPLKSTAYVLVFSPLQVADEVGDEWARPQAADGRWRGGKNHEWCDPAKEPLATTACPPNN